MCYKDGDGADKDPYKSAYWFVKSADQAHPEAAYEAAKCYQAGVDGVEIVTTNLETPAAVYFQRDGVVTSKLVTAIIDYFSLAAQQDHVESQYELGLCYQSGIGVTKSKEISQSWFQTASDRGHVQAKMCLILGEYVLDPTDRFRMCQSVATEGLVDGQYELAVCFRDGYGVEIDTFTANIWFQRASSQVLDILYNHCSS